MNDRKESEEEYVRKLEESIEWNKKDEQISRIIWENNKEVSLEEKP